MKKYILFSFITILSIFACQHDANKEPNGELPNPFPEKAYDYVMAYHYNGEDGKYIWEDNQLHPSVINSKKLAQQETETLLSILNNKEHYGGDVSRCFRPHLGFIFYNQEDIPTAHISICFECNNHKASSTILAVEEAPMNMRGYSAEGRRQLIDFCKKLAFGHCMPDFEEMSSGDFEDDLLY